MSADADIVLARVRTAKLDAEWSNGFRISTPRGVIVFYRGGTYGWRMWRANGSPLPLDHQRNRILRRKSLHDLADVVAPYCTDAVREANVSGEFANIANLLVALYGHPIANLGESMAANAVLRHFVEQTVRSAEHEAAVEGMREMWEHFDHGDGPLIVAGLIATE